MTTIIFVGFHANGHFDLHLYCCVISPSSIFAACEVSCCR